MAAAESGIPRFVLVELRKTLPWRLRSSAMHMRAVERAIAIVDDRLPATLPRLAEALQRARLTHAPFDARGVVEAASLLEGATPFVVEGGDPPIVTHAHAGGVRNAVSLGCWLALGRSPVALVDDALVNLKSRGRMHVWRTLVTDLIDAQTEFAWLDDDRTRFGHAGWIENVTATIGALLDPDVDLPLHELAETLAAHPMIARRCAVDDLRRIVSRMPGVEVEAESVRRRRSTPIHDEPAIGELARETDESGVQDPTAGAAKPTTPLEQREEALADDIASRMPSSTRSSAGPDDVVAAESVRILDAIRRSPPYGVSMTELEVELAIPRSRLRDRLRELEVRGMLVRNGVSRSTRYAIPRSCT